MQNSFIVKSQEFLFYFLKTKTLTTNLNIKYSLKKKKKHFYAISKHFFKPKIKNTFQKKNTLTIRNNLVFLSLLELKS